MGKQENIIFEKDYEGKHKQQPTSADTNVFDHAVSSGFFKRYSDACDALPKEIIPESKASYEIMLSRYDEIASTWGGKIRGIVNYEKWEAVIDVYLPFFEFETEDDRTLLLETALRADSVTFQVEKEGNIRMHLFFCYFRDIGDKDKILEKTIREDAELMRLLEESAAQRKE